MKKKKNIVEPKRSITRNEVTEIEEPESSKITSKKRVMYNNFVDENKEEIKDNKEQVNDNNVDTFGFLLIEKIFRDNYLLISPTFEDVSKGNKPFKRKIIIWLYFIIQLVVIVRFLVLAFVNKPWVWSLLADPFYILEQEICFILCFYV